MENLIQYQIFECLLKSQTPLSSQTKQMRKARERNGSKMFCVCGERKEFPIFKFLLCYFLFICYCFCYHFYYYFCEIIPPTHSTFRKILDVHSEISAVEIFKLTPITKLMDTQQSPYSRNYVLTELKLKENFPFSLLKIRNYQTLYNLTS